MLILEGATCDVVRVAWNTERLGSGLGKNTARERRGSPGSVVGYGFRLNGAQCAQQGPQRVRTGQCGKNSLHNSRIVWVWLWSVDA